MGKKMIIKGVGQFMAKRIKSNGGTEVISLGTLQNLKLDFTVDMEDIFGGDGLFPIDNLIKQKTIEITATDAKFDLASLQLMMGASIQEQVEDEVWVLGEGHTLASDSNGTATAAKAKVNFDTTLAVEPEISVRLLDANKLLTKESYAVDTAPGEGKFMFDGNTGEIFVSDSLAGTDILVNYKRKSTIDVADIIVDEVPFPVYVVHHGSFEQKDGTYQGIEIELYSCRAKGTFSIL